MKDADKLKLMLLAWNYSLQQQAQVTGPGGVPGQLPTGADASGQMAQPSSQQQVPVSTASVALNSALSPSNGNVVNVATTASAMPTVTSGQSSTCTANGGASINTNTVTLTGKPCSLHNFVMLELIY